MTDPDPLVFVMKEVFDGEAVLTVYHESDDDWQYLTAGEATRENAQLVHQSHVFGLDPSLRELLSMPLGTWATRSSTEGPWHFGQVED
jgi:hypothetical protein